MMERLITMSVVFVFLVVIPILWCFIQERIQKGGKIKLRCALIGHNYLTEVHYDEYPKAICRAAIVQRCDRCNYNKIKIATTLTSFILSTKFVEQEDKPKLHVVK